MAVEIMFSAFQVVLGAAHCFQVLLNVGMPLWNGCRSRNGRCRFIGSGAQQPS
jgi:hypothetical protein